MDETKDIARLFQKNGTDIISVSGGVAESRPRRDEFMEQGKFLELAKGIKEAIQIPVIAVGKILNLSQAEQILNDGVADLVAICRAIIADPELITKTVENRVEEIQECIECGECGASLMKDDMRMQCSVNEEWGVIIKASRDWTILHILFYAGCRISEINSLKAKDFYEYGGYWVLDFIVKDGKRKKLAIHQELQITFS